MCHVIHMTKIEKDLRSLYDTSSHSINFTAINNLQMIMIIELINSGGTRAVWIVTASD